MWRFLTCTLAVAACGTPAPRLALGDGADAPAEVPDAGIPDALAIPPVQAALVWTAETKMSPNGPLDRVTLVDTAGGGFPLQFAVSVSAPPPPDALADATTYGIHAISIEIVLLRSGAIDASGYAPQCEEWGYANYGLYYMTDTGAWFSQMGDPTIYSQGYHLFGANVIDAGPCSDPMCPGPTVQMYEVPLDSQVTITLSNPQCP